MNSLANWFIEKFTGKLFSFLAKIIFRLKNNFKNSIFLNFQQILTNFEDFLKSSRLFLFRIHYFLNKHKCLQETKSQLKVCLNNLLPVIFDV